MFNATCRWSKGGHRVKGFLTLVWEQKKESTVTQIHALENNCLEKLQGNQQQPDIINGRDPTNSRIVDNCKGTVFENPFS